MQGPRCTHPRRVVPLVRRFPAVLALATALAPAQGIRWSSAAVAPTLHVREHADRTWTLCFDGWSLTGGVPFQNGHEGTAVGIDPGARTVTTSSADVLKGGEGGNAFLDTFPFAPNTAVEAIFRTQMPGLDRFAFLAPIVGTVPDAGLAAVAYRIQILGPNLKSILVPMFANTRMGMATTDAMGTPTGRIFVVAPGAVRLARILDFRFDRGVGSEEINAAGIEGGATSRGTLLWSTGTPWTSGRTGRGLRAGATLRAGFRGDLGGRFTLAWSMRGSTAPASASPICSVGGFRVFTGGAAGVGLRCTGIGSSQTLDLGDDIQTKAAQGWVHLALVVDGDASLARWYVNGVLRRTLVLTAFPAIPASSADFEIGSTGTLTNVYDLDEFWLSADAESAATIADLALAPAAAAVPYTGACGANLRSQGTAVLGLPFEYRIEGPRGAVATLTLGTGTAIGSLPLPIDLGVVYPGLSGCPWYSDLSTSLPGLVIPVGGVLALPFSMPKIPALSGLSIHAQALVASPLGITATNAHLTIPK